MPQEELNVHLEKLQWVCVCVCAYWTPENPQGDRSRQGMDDLVLTKVSSDCKVSLLCLWNGAQLLSFPSLPALCVPGTCRADAEPGLSRLKRTSL